MLLPPLLILALCAFGASLWFFYPAIRQWSAKAFSNQTRPQEPPQPSPYASHPVQFKSGELEFAGTFTVPAGQAPFPAVVLVHGSGAHDRDETIFDHKPFWLLADYLSRRGVAVLRYDKRGCGSSGGTMKGATTEDFSRDARAALEYLKARQEVDCARLGLLGHSEGGIIVSCVAAASTDVRFIVLLAGAALPGEEILLKQIEAMGKQAAAAATQKALELARGTYAILRSNSDDEKALSEIKQLRERLATPEYMLSGREREVAMAQVEAGLPLLTSPWFRHFLVFDPRTALSQVKCPVLALNGEKDCQVSCAENLAAIKAATASGGNEQVTIVALPDLNHLFQHCDTGLPSEYASIEETIAPDVLNLISDWVLALPAG